MKNCIGVLCLTAGMLFGMESDKSKGAERRSFTRRESIEPSLIRRASAGEARLETRDNEAFKKHIAKLERRKSSCSERSWLSQENTNERKG